ncbi:hypothetical protein GCM10010207_00560 [Streptomyces atratus]|nr:hypothetical protein GCM10010207_00560 [Streptomyces atratus]
MLKQDSHGVRVALLGREHERSAIEVAIGAVNIDTVRKEHPHKVRVPLCCGPAQRRESDGSVTCLDIGRRCQEDSDRIEVTAYDRLKKGRSPRSPGTHVHVGLGLNELPH